MEATTAAILVACAILLIYVNAPTYDVPRPTDVRKYANITTYPLGCIDERVMHSMYHLVFGIYVLAHKQGKFESAVDVVQLWSHNQNDVMNYVHAGCDKALNRVIDTLEDKDKELSCNPKFDYHEIPKTLQFNDFIDIQDLINKIDELLEVESNG